ncbi:MAG: hypothetical protein L6R42_008923 [Xanthoria sp. 1 TBL-2021]|nr:MAG: hypothetical protein L6R42_008923 [Xanthoria sp. 1 TBL-2021]
MKLIPNSGVIHKYDRPAKTAQGFPFMELPPEVRNMVYKEVLKAPWIIDIDAWWNSYPRCSLPQLVTEDYSPGESCRLLRVSKAIHNEAYPVYFGCNTFSCNGFRALRGFLSKLKREYSRSIRSPTFEFWGESPAKAIRLLQGCVSLQYLQIDFTIKTLFEYRSRKSDSLTLPGFNDLIKIRGIRRLRINRPKIETNKDAYWETILDKFDFESFIEGLQVLKRPRSEAMVRRQDRKDFPPEKAKRTVYGKANVKTRSERAIADGDKGED